METDKLSYEKQKKRVWRFLLIPLVMFLFLGCLDLVKRHQQSAANHMLELSLAFNDLQSGLQTFFTSRKTDGLAGLRETKAKFEMSLADLDQGQQFSSVQKANFASLNKSWGASKNNIDLIFRNESQFTSFQNAISDTQEKNKTMQDAYQKIIKFLLDNHFSGNKVATVQRQPWMADRISLRLLWLQRPLAFSPNSLKILKDESTMFLSESIPALQAILGEIAQESDELKALLVELDKSIKDYAAALQSVVEKGDALIKLNLHKVVQNSGINDTDAKLAAFTSSMGPAQTAKNILFNPWLSRILFWIASALTLLGLYLLSKLFARAPATALQSAGVDFQEHEKAAEAVKEAENLLQLKEQELSGLKAEHEQQIESLKQEIQAKEISSDENLNEEMIEKVQEYEVEIRKLSDELEENKILLAQAASAESSDQREALEALQLALEQKHNELSMLEAQVVDNDFENLFYGEQEKVQLMQDKTQSLESELESAAQEKALMQNRQQDVERQLAEALFQVEQLSEANISEGKMDLDLKAFIVHLKEMRQGDLSDVFENEKPQWNEASQQINLLSKSMQQLVKAVKISSQQTHAAATQKQAIVQSMQYFINLYDMDAIKQGKKELNERIKELSLNTKLQYAATGGNAELALILDELEHLEILSQAILAQVDKPVNLDMPKELAWFDRLDTLSAKLKGISDKFTLSD